MAQQFQADAVGTSATVNVPTTTETPILTGNPLPIPFENGKCLVQGTLVITPGTGTTSITIRVRRNPAGENVVVGTAVIVAGFVAGSAGDIGFGFVDPIPDGRTCVYQLTVQQAGAGANGTAQLGCLLQTTVLSG